MPKCNFTANEIEILGETTLLIVEQRSNRTDVQDRDAAPRLLKHPGDHRKKCRFSLASSRWSKHDKVGLVEKGVDRQRLHFAQFPPTQGIDNVVLKCWM